MNDQLLLRGARLSLLLHGLILSSIFYVGTVLPELTPPLVIDFSITDGCADGQSCNAAPKPADSSKETVALTPPVPESLPVSQPRPVERKIATVKPNEPEKGEKTKPVAKKIVSVQAKKKLVVQSPPEPVAEITAQEVVRPEIETSSETSAENLSPEVETVVHPMVPATTGSHALSSSPKEKYIKANFSFIRDAVERNTTYPVIARRMGWEGRVLISFVVGIDGQVEDIRVIQSCGFKPLDNNAVNTIKRCAPFPRPPLRAEITLPITYRLN